VNGFFNRKHEAGFASIENRRLKNQL